MLGKKVLIMGKAERITRLTKSVMMKGITPRIILDIGTSTTVAMAKRLSPKGGVILPISQILTMSTLYQIKLKPSASMGREQEFRVQIGLSVRWHKYRENSRL